jgi:hypothetical protein
MFSHERGEINANDGDGDGIDGRCFRGKVGRRPHQVHVVGKDSFELMK